MTRIESESASIKETRSQVAFLWALFRRVALAVSHFLIGSPPSDTAVAFPKGVTRPGVNKALDPTRGLLLLLNVAGNASDAAVSGSAPHQAPQLLG